MRSLLKAIRSGLLLAALCGVPQGGAEAGVWWLRVSSAIGVAPPVAALQTIEPSSAWSGTAGSVKTAVPVAMSPAVAVPLGQQAIQNVTNDGGSIGFDVPDTSAMSDGEQWLVSGTGVADGFWKIQIVSPTHVRPCSTLSGNLNGYTCGGPAYASGATTGGTIGFPEKAIGIFDTPPFVWITDAGTTVCIGAASGTRAFIDHVNFSMEGNVVAVSQQMVSPDHGTQGWCIHPQSRTAANGTPLDGDANLFAEIVPKNGFTRVQAIILTLNTNGTISRPVRYVDCVNGSDSANGLTAAAAFKTVQRGFNASPSGAVVSVLAPSGAATITPGAHTLVGWSGNNLQPGGTVAFSGTLPSPMVAGAPYYVMPDNFVAGQSFEVTDQIIGLNTPAERDPLGAVRTAPLATSGSAVSVTATGTTCVEPDTKPSPNLNARAITLTPAVPHSVTLAKVARNGAATSIILSPYVNRSIYDDITFDMSTVGILQTSGSPPGLLLVQNSRLIDPNGANPPFAYYVNDAGVSGPTDQSSSNVYALTESIISYQNTAGVRLMRNVKAWASYDIYAVGAYGGRATNSALAVGNAALNMGVGVFNYDAHKHGNLYTRQTQNITSVSAVGPYSNGTTTITLAGAGAYSNPGLPTTKTANATLVIYNSSAIGGQPFAITAVDKSAGTVTVSGDATAAQVGDQALWGDQSHSDNFQISAASVSTTPCNPDAPLENVYMQRYRTRVDYSTDSFQGLLGQAGVCGPPAGVTATVAGRQVTFSSAVYFQPNEVVWFNTSAANTMVQSGRVDAAWNGGAAANTTSVTLAAKLTGNVPDGSVFNPFVPATGLGWSHGLMAKDIAFVNSWMSANGACQPQHGQMNWVMLQTTWVGCSWTMRDQMLDGGRAQPGFYLESFAWFDSIARQYGSSSKPFAPGNVMDNSVITEQASAPDGENMLAISTPLSVNANGSPIGLGKTLRLPPAVPWDYYGQPKTVGSSIGAVN